jgi:hypothetical protein
MSTGFILFLVVSLIGLSGFIASIIQRRNEDLSEPSDSEPNNEYSDDLENSLKPPSSIYWDAMFDVSSIYHNSPSYSYLPGNIWHYQDD